MKKYFALFLTMCMLVVGTSTSVLAAENEQYVVIGNTSFRVFPGKGENLKIHLYLYTNNKITISVRPEGGSSRTVATWNSKGHHWADLVRGTNGKGYWITISGSTIADGGVYSEP